MLPLPSPFALLRRRPTFRFFMPCSNRVILNVERSGSSEPILSGVRMGLPAPNVSASRVGDSRHFFHYCLSPELRKRH